MEKLKVGGTYQEVKETFNFLSGWNDLHDLFPLLTRKEYLDLDNKTKLILRN